jgi:hypothetical protein
MLNCQAPVAGISLYVAQLWRRLQFERFTSRPYVGAELRASNAVEKVDGPSGSSIRRPNAFSRRFMTYLLFSAPIQQAASPCGAVAGGHHPAIHPAILQPTLRVNPTPAFFDDYPVAAIHATS